MPKRLLAVFAMLVVLLAALVGCSADDAPSATGGEDVGDAVPTLTKATIPTEVGTKWVTIRRDEEGTPLDLTVEGPWSFTTGEGWHTEDYEIVDPASVPGIDQFDGYTFVVKSQYADNPAYYYPRVVTDDWVQGMGRIESYGGELEVDSHEPVNSWPLDLKVGQTYTVSDTDQASNVATVLARNTAVVPAGTIEDAYLVRFRLTSKSGDQEPDDYYYLFAPNVGQVAYFHYLEGSEEAGFTSAGSIVLLASMPTQQ